MQEDSFHNEIHNWPYWIPDFTKIQQYELYANKDVNNGRTGLINVGNTCFMASGLQCLSHTEDLTKYFLSGMFNQELNNYNHFGSKGVISKAYCDLLSHLWNNKLPCINPNIFRVPFSRRTGYYRDNSQQDSQEMISIILDNLHEDLNRINTKPYFDLKERMPGETDDQASQRWWECHKKRDDSIIVDLFHGQFKATLICPQCNKINITYDPFIFLSLPIPSEINIIKYKMFKTNSLICEEHTMSFFHDTKVIALKKNILRIYPNIEIDCLEIVILNKDQTIKDFPNDNISLHSLIQNYEEVLCYEKQSKSSILVYIYPIHQSNTTTFFFQPNISISYLYYPWASSFDSNCTLGDIWIETFTKMKSICKFKESDNAFSLNKMKQWKLPEISPFTLHFSHQYSNKKCSFCESSSPLCEVSFLRFNFEIPYKNFLSKSHSNPKVIFYASLPQNTYLKRIDSKVGMPLISKAFPSLIQCKNQYQIYDCLNLFCSEEQLSSENTWYCNTCKKHQEAWRKIDIYHAPNYLIVHFKRFKIKSNNAFLAFFNNHKNNALINFPMKNLDLSKYIIGPNARNAIYDLYAVVNHSGGLNMGHYHAYCKNKGKWLWFNDEKVNSIDESEVVNSNAYLLFYKKQVMESF